MLHNSAVSTLHDMYVVLGFHERIRSQSVVCAIYIIQKTRACHPELLRPAKDTPVEACRIIHIAPAILPGNPVAWPAMMNILVSVFVSPAAFWRAVESTLHCFVLLSEASEASLGCVCLVDYCGCA